MNTVIPALAAPAVNITPVRPNPWSRLGAPLELRPDLTDRDVLARSGLDWKVRLAGLYTDAFNPVADYRAVLREDTGRALGVVSPDYKIVQNDQLLGFIRALAANAPVNIETAGYFKHGALTWIQARLPELDLRLGSDLTRSYLMLSNGHDGQRPLVVGFTTVRVICANTLALATREVKGNRNRTDLMRGHVVRHTAGINAALGDMLNAYKSAITGHQQTRDLYQHLATVPLTKQLERSFFERIFAAEGPSESDRAESIRKNRDERLQQILASPTSRVPGTVGTAFSLLQSVIEYIDYHRPTRTSEGENADAARLFSATFGSGMTLKRKAVETITDLAHAA
jgi:phage/plasmid-like protein (TIGR03299 family)